METREYEDVEIMVPEPGSRESFYPLLSFTREFHRYTENYGEDADGRRGVRQRCVEDNRVYDVLVGGIPLKAFNDDWQTAIGNALDRWLDDNYPKED